jgi:hypothetical protein
MMGRRLRRGQQDGVGAEAEEAGVQVVPPAPTGPQTSTLWQQLPAEL